MGVDLYFHSNPCKTCGHQEEWKSFCCTYNLSPMWYAIYPDAKGLIDIEGMNGREAAKYLSHAKKELIKRRDEMINLEPPNGWGSYNGFLDLIDKLIITSRGKPKFKWGAGR